MVSPPSIPTDNLYKFMAISGLTLVLFSITLTIFRLDRALERSDHLRLEIAALASDVDEARTDLTRLETIRNPTEVQIRDIRERSRDLNSRNAGAVVRAKIVSRLVDDLHETVRWCFAGMIVGTILSGVGFRLWYTRVQVFLDRSLSREGRGNASTEAEPGR